jgi:hypothetical protein
MATSRVSAKGSPGAVENEQALRADQVGERNISAPLREQIFTRSREGAKT